jgi:hypothetical protein
MLGLRAFVGKPPTDDRDRRQTIKLSREQIMSAFSHHADASMALRGPFLSGLRRLLRSNGRRIAKLDLDAVPGAMKRDLGLADGRMVPCRDLLRD